MFVCIEGFDVVGKTTLVSALHQRVQKSGRRAVTYSFPRYHTRLGMVIDTWLKDGRALTMPEAFQAMMSADKLEAGAEVQDLLEYGNVVISSRYWQSAVVYGANSGVDPEMLWKMHRGSPLPNLNILLDMDVRTALARRPDKRDAYEKNPSFLEGVRERYLKLWAEPPEESKKSAHWSIVDASQPQEKVEEDVWNLMETKPWL